MLHPKILPVIHFINRATAYAQVEAAQAAGSDGCFLISHRGDDAEILAIAHALHKDNPSFPIGVNLLSTETLAAAESAHALGLPFLWADSCGVDSSGITPMGFGLSALAGQALLAPFEIFASVAFKYRIHEPHPALAAKNALDAGFIPTTSGAATGSAPDLSKIIAMSEATGGVLAVASGMDPGNVAQYAPYLSHILVATGVSIDEHTLDPVKLRLLIERARTP